MTGKFAWQSWIFVLLLLAPLAGANAAYTFSVVSQQLATRTVLIWGPLMKYLKEQTGQDFRRGTTRNIPAFEQNLREGRANFSSMNAYHYTVFHDTQGYQALVRTRDRVIKGFMAAENAGWDDVRALKLGALQDGVGSTLP